MIFFFRCLKLATQPSQHITISDTKHTAVNQFHTFKKIKLKSHTDLRIKRRQKNKRQQCAAFESNNNRFKCFNEITNKSKKKISK